MTCGTRGSPRCPGPPPPPRCEIAWRCCTPVSALPGRTCPTRPCWNGSTTGWPPRSTPSPADDAGAPSISSTRCDGCCPGRRPPAWTSWSPSASRSRAATTPGSPIPRTTTRPVARWCGSSCRSASAGRRRRRSWTGGCRSPSTCCRPRSDRSRSPTTWRPSGAVPTSRCGPRCAGATRVTPGPRTLVGPGDRARQAPRLTALLGRGTTARAGWVAVPERSADGLSRS